MFWIVLITKEMTKWGSFFVELVHCESGYVTVHCSVTHKLHDVFKLVDIFMLMIRMSSKRGWAKILVQIKLAIMFPRSGYTGQFRNLLRRSWFLSWGERPVLDLKGVHLKAGEQMLELGIHLFKNQEHWSYFLPWQSLPTGQLCRNRRGTSPQYQNRYLDLVVCYKF